METFSVNSSTRFIKIRNILSINETIENLENIINNENFNILKIDLKGQNLIYSTRIGALASTLLLAKNPNLKLQIITDSKEAISYLSTLGMDNLEITFNNEDLISDFTFKNVSV